jgi:hypothetical protein
MKIYLYVILFILFIFLLTKIKTQKQENFDEKINRTSRTNCGIMCTKILGCNAFSVDENNNICYLSKDKIFSNNRTSLFSLDFNSNNVICNKIKKVDDYVSASQTELRENASYTCKNGLSDPNETIKYYINDEKIISSLDKIPYLPMKEYTFDEINWGTEISFDDNKHLIINPTQNNSFIVMREKNDEYVGEYMYNNKCTTNISKNNCLKNCIDNDKCLGTEWNQVYLKNDGDDLNIFSGVCCPKTKINKVIPRRNEFKFGKFYLKDTLIKNNIDNKEIHTIID